MSEPPPTPEEKPKPPTQPEDDERTWLEIVTQGGRFLTGLIFAFAFVYLVYKIGSILDKLDISKVEPSNIIIAIVTGAITLASAVASFYFATRQQS